MKIPFMKGSVKNRRLYFITCAKELGAMDRPDIYCYSKKQAHQVVDYYLKHGEVKVYVDPFSKKKKPILKKFEGMTKLVIWEAVGRAKVGRVRKRTMEIGGNIQDGVFFK